MYMGEMVSLFSPNFVNKYTFPQSKNPCLNITHFYRWTNSNIINGVNLKQIKRECNLISRKLNTPYVSKYEITVPFLARE